MSKPKKEPAGRVMHMDRDMALARIDRIGVLLGLLCNEIPGLIRIIKATSTPKRGPGIRQVV